jgi:hypothetical protein
MSRWHAFDENWGKGDVGVKSDRREDEFTGHSPTDVTLTSGNK